MVQHYNMLHKPPPSQRATVLPNGAYVYAKLYVLRGISKQAESMKNTKKIGYLWEVCCRCSIYTPTTSRRSYLAIAAQSKSFEQVEHLRAAALEGFTEYYVQNNLKPNLSKTQVCAFHLRNTGALRNLKVEWAVVELEQTYNSK